MFLLLALFGLSGVSLLTFLVPFPQGRQTRDSGRAVYASPPADWPDIPVAALRLFDRAGQINTPVLIARPPVRVTSFAAAQDILLAQVRSRSADRPEIALRLSPDDGGWTDVLLDGAVLAQVPTSAMIAHGSGGSRAA